jgi:twitching motility protein PilT
MSNKNDNTKVQDTEVTLNPKQDDIDQTKTAYSETKTEYNETKTMHASASQGVSVHQLLKLMVQEGASDLHLTVGSPPAMRLHGDVIRVKVPPLKGEDTRRLIYQVLSDEQKRELEKSWELDFSFGIKGLARFRGNVYYAQKTLSAAFRQIPSLIPDFDTLGLPKSILQMIDVANGLVLVTGPTGSGKSTTLAAIIDRLNKEEQGHIITLEDPIEFVHTHKSCLVNQREIGTDSMSFSRGLKSLLRQDPDIILVGELRDQETIEAALTIAETGHLVFGTLHTNSTIQTINRIINVFPSDKQEQIRNLLSFVLQGVVAQQLAPRIGGGRQLVQEILRPTMAIRNLIREDKIHQIYSQMQVGQGETGMKTMNQDLLNLLEKKRITQESALDLSNNPDEMRKALGITNKKSA